MDLLVVAAFLLVSFLEFAIPLALAFWLAKKFGIRKKLFLYGALFFIAVQVLHTPLVFLTETPLYQSLEAIGIDKISAIAIYSIYLGLLAGLFEEIGRFLVFKKFFPWKKTKTTNKNALMFGAGWGGFESMMVGSLVLLILFSYIFAAPLTEQQIADLNALQGKTLTEQDVENYNAQIEALMNLTPLPVLLGLFERIMTMTLHIAWALMVLAAVVQNKKYLLWVAVLWHSAVDALAVFIAYGLKDVLLAEVAVFVFFLVALFYIKKNWPKRE